MSEIISVAALEQQVQALENLVREGMGGVVRRVHADELSKAQQRRGEEERARDAAQKERDALVTETASLKAERAELTAEVGRLTRQREDFKAQADAEAARLAKLERGVVAARAAHAKVAENV